MVTGNLWAKKWSLTTDQMRQAHSAASEQGLIRIKSGIAWLLNLFALKAELRTLFVVANGGDPNAVRKNAVEKMVGESPQIRAAQIPKNFIARARARPGG